VNLHSPVDNEASQIEQASPLSPREGEAALSSGEGDTLPAAANKLKR
jgi:hypothetical protein